MEAPPGEGNSPPNFLPGRDLPGITKMEAATARAPVRRLAQKDLFCRLKICLDFSLRMWYHKDTKGGVPK